MLALGGLVVRQQNIIKIWKPYILADFRNNGVLCACGEPPVSKGWGVNCSHNGGSPRGPSDSDTSESSLLFCLPLLSLLHQSQGAMIILQAFNNTEMTSTFLLLNWSFQLIKLNPFSLPLSRKHPYLFHVIQSQP